MAKIPLKNTDEIKKMIISGQILSEVLEKVANKAKEGITTIALDRLAEAEILKTGAKPSFKGYKGYGNVSCLSVNNEIVHSPGSLKKLENGDIISIDLGVNYQGYCTDAAITVPIGKINAEKAKLISTCYRALEDAIKVSLDGNSLGDIGNAIQNVTEKAGFNLVQNLTGHGIGRLPQEEPSVPNFGNPNEGIKLKEGMCLAIEPMITSGNGKIILQNNGWTIETQDGQPASHFEQTIAITKEQPKILTPLPPRYLQF